MHPHLHFIHMKCVQTDLEIIIRSGFVLSWGGEYLKIPLPDYEGDMVIIIHV